MPIIVTLWIAFCRPDGYYEQMPEKHRPDVITRHNLGSLEVGGIYEKLGMVILKVGNGDIEICNDYLAGVCNICTRVSCPLNKSKTKLAS